MTLRGPAHALPAFPDDSPMTMADVEAMTERLGLVIITDGKRYDYARPGEHRPGWRRFAMAQRARPLKATEPQ